MTQPPRSAVWSLRSRLSSSISESRQCAAKMVKTAAIAAEAASMSGALTFAAARIAGNATASVAVTGSTAAFKRRIMESS